MCGIVGFVDCGRDISGEYELLEKMNRTLLPRGTDQNGFWLSKHAAVGHTRLAIIDITNGTQPMLRACGEKHYVLTYNGMLYNMHPLRRELEALGHTFTTRSDAEVVLMAYIQWGAGCLTRFNGIFAFAIWNDQCQELFLARDRFGTKPLFYAERDGELIFGSELKALLAHPKVEPVIDREGVAEIFGLGPTRTPGLGVFKDVYEVKAAHYAIWRNGRLEQKRYWEFQSRPHTDDLKTTAEKVRGLVKEAVTGQLLSDVPLCTLLSGGLDSSAISAITAKALAYDKGARADTYSFDYQDNDRYFKRSSFQPDSDSEWVGRMVEEYRTNHRYLTINMEELVKGLEDAVVARDLPGMADIDSSLLYFCKEIKKRHTVVLSGECADEIFGGYPWLRSEKAFKTPAFPWSHDSKIREDLLCREVKYYADIPGYVDRRYREAMEVVPRMQGECGHAARLRELSYLNVSWFMTQLLERSDRLSAAAGLEMRVPYCDHRLAEYVWNIPWAMKCLGGREKGILRLALKGILPDDVLGRRKSPYPKTHNPIYEEAVRGRLRDVLCSGGAPVCELIDRERVLEMMDQPSDTGAPFFGQLMARPQMYAYLLQVNFWMEKYGVIVR